MSRIKLTCDTCNKIWDLPRTDEIPLHVFSMGCNWCPVCEDQATDYYEEWYNEDEHGEPEPPIPDNQLTMPFIFDELGCDVVVASYDQNIQATVIQPL